MYLRKEKKLSQEELAYKLGVSRQSVSKWESGAAYPETEKILGMCKLFDCTLDELMNQNIQEETQEEARKYTFNDFLRYISGIVQRSIGMITSMNAKSLIRFIFELGLLFILILIARIPFEYIFRAGANIFTSVDNEYFNILLAFWKFLVDIVYLVVAVVSFVYIYKIRFIDAFGEGTQEGIYNRKKIVEGDIETNVRSEVKEKRENAGIKYDFGIFSIIGKIALLFVKCFVGFCSLFVIFFFLASIAGLVIGISWIFQGIFYWSILLFLLSLIIFLGMLIIILYNFIFDRKTAWKNVLSVLLATLAGLGISVGIGFIELKEFTVVNGYESSMLMDREVREFLMHDTLIVNSAYGIYYIEDNSLTDKVRVEVKYLKDLSEVHIEESSYNEKNRINVSVYSSADGVSLKKVYNIFLHDLKRKVINSDYGNIFYGEISLYTSRENIEKIRDNVNNEMLNHYDEVVYP